MKLQVAGKIDAFFEQVALDRTGQVETLAHGPGGRQQLIGGHRHARNIIGPGRGIPPLG
jgi:hypothetical protein